MEEEPKLAVDSNSQLDPRGRVRGNRSARLVANPQSSAGLAYGLAVGLYALVFHFWQIEPVPLSAYAAGVLMWAVACAPLAIWYRGGRNGVPIFELICLAYGASYGPPVYLVPNQILILNQQLRLDWPLTTQCTLLATAGLGVLIVGYYVTLRGVRNLSVARVNLPFSPERQKIFTNLALFCGLVVSVIVSLSSSDDNTFKSIFRLLASQFNIGICLLAYEVFSARESNSGRLTLLWVCTGIGVLLALTGGMLEGVVLPLMLVLIVRWHVRKKFPYGLAIFVGVLFLVLNPIKHEYRERVWYGEYSDSGFMQRLNVWVELVSEQVQGKSSRIVEDEPGGFREAMERIDLLHKFVHVKTRTPAEIPYLSGISYEYMLYSYIPRFLWAEKPVATEATDLVDYAYGFRSPQEENKGTKIAIGQVAEVYANYGEWGILIVMLVQGVFFALLNHFMNGPQSAGARVIYLAAMVAFLNGIGTSAVILFGGILQFLVASALLMLPFTMGADGVRSTRRSRRERGGNDTPAFDPASTAETATPVPPAPRV